MRTQILFDITFHFQNCNVGLGRNVLSEFLIERFNLSKTIECRQPSDSEAVALFNLKHPNINHIQLFKVDEVVNGREWRGGNNFLISKVW